MEYLNKFANSDWALNFVEAIGVLIFGYAVGKVVSKGLRKVFGGVLENQTAAILEKFTLYAIVAIFLMGALSKMGVDLKVLLGAAGIFTVAIGFASQTSASNLISGLFMVSERPFVPGDVIRIGETTGEVLSIDLLSTKLRTMDNLLVRIPNESLMKSQIQNLTYFPLRRIDIKVGVSYHSDLKRVQEILNEQAEDNPLCLVEPPPLFIVESFGPSSVDLQFSVWVKRENFLKVKNEMYRKIKVAFEKANIEIPFPQSFVHLRNIETI